MDRKDALRILNTMKEYFEMGNRETDSVAKLILESDFEFAGYWHPKIKQIKEGTDWTGIRTIEAELLISALNTSIARLEEYS